MSDVQAEPGAWRPDRRDAVPDAGGGAGRDVDALLRANVAQVFNEHDDRRRLAAMADLWAQDASMFEAEDRFDGLEAISANVGALLARLPAGLRFTPAGPAIVNHDAAMLRWTAAVEGGHPLVTGVDLAFVEAGRIRRMYVFLDPHDA